MNKMFKAVLLGLVLSLSSPPDLSATLLLSDVTVDPDGPTISGVSIVTNFNPPVVPGPPFPSFPATFLSVGTAVGDTLPAADLAGAGINIVADFDPVSGFVPGVTSSLLISDLFSAPPDLLEATLVDSLLSEGAIELLFAIDGGTPQVAGAFTNGFLKASLTGSFGSDPFGLLGAPTFDESDPVFVDLEAVVALPEPSPSVLLLTGLALLALGAGRRRTRLRIES